MSLSDSQKKYLRGLGHKLKPVIRVGNAGLTEPLLAEFSSTLLHHELIKVGVRAHSRQARAAIIGKLCAHGSAELVQRVGNTALLYRPNPEQPRIVLPVDVKCT